MSQEDVHAIDRLHMDDVIAGNADIVEKEHIEDALMVIKSAQHKVDFLRRLKQHRVQAIDSQVKAQEARIEALKTAITKCMNIHKEKTLDFPELAKVSIRKVKGTWIIDNEQDLVNHLKKLNKFEEVGEEVIKFNKTKLNKTLTELETFNNTSKAVHREEDKNSLTVSFYESSIPVESIDDLLPAPLPKPAIPQTTSLIPIRKFDLSDDLEGLNF